MFNHVSTAPKLDEAGRSSNRGKGMRFIRSDLGEFIGKSKSNIPVVHAVPVDHSVESVEVNCNNFYGKDCLSKII